jgi:hypothetical protein
MSCCSSHSDQNSKKKKTSIPEDKLPKSVVGKYLYNLGKKDMEKEKHGGKHKGGGGGCC